MPNFTIRLLCDKDAPGAVVEYSKYSQSAPHLKLEGAAALEYYADNRDKETRIVAAKNGMARMTAGTRSGLLACDKTPRQGTKPGDRYDERRARLYYEKLTGKTAGKVLWALHTVHGEAKPRVRGVRDHATNAMWEIPHWDWNGHNATLADCEVHEPADIFA